MTPLARDKRIVELNDEFETKLHKMDEVYLNMLSIAETLYNPILTHDITAFKKLADDMLGIVITIYELKQYKEEDLLGAHYD